MSSVAWCRVFSPLSEGTVLQSVPLWFSARQWWFWFSVFRPEALWWTAGQTSPLHLHLHLHSSLTYTDYCSCCSHKLMSVSFLSIQVAIKQISRDRVQQWARLVSDTNITYSVSQYSFPNSPNPKYIFTLVREEMWFINMWHIKDLGAKNSWASDWSINQLSKLSVWVIQTSTSSFSCTVSVCVEPGNGAQGSSALCWTDRWTAAVGGGGPWFPWKPVMSRLSAEGIPLSDKHTYYSSQV